MKLLRLGTSLRAAGFQTFNSSPSQTFTTSCSRCEPLQILYCGSDDFSVASLRKLNEERLANPELIESIDVVCKPPQRVGRGLKRLREGGVSSYTTSIMILKVEYSCHQTSCRRVVFAVTPDSHVHRLAASAQ